MGPLSSTPRRRVHARSFRVPRYKRRMRQEQESLLIDRSAAAAVPDDRGVIDFLTTQRVFISSVMADLQDERRAVAAALVTLGAKPVWFEAFGGRDDDPEGAYLSEVASSTIYVGILGRRYGKLLASRRSASHEEYREAERRGLRISVWTIASQDWDGDQQSFVDEVRTFHTTGSIVSPEHLADGVVERLRRIAAEELSPWCKLGPALFRARRIQMTSKGLEVETHVRDDEVAAFLESLRPTGWGTRDIRFTDPAHSLLVRVDEVEATATSARGRDLVLHMQEQQGAADAFLGTSYEVGGRFYSHDDLVELALREHLLGERNPVEHSFLTLPHPLRALPDDLSEEIIRPIARLLLTEALVGSGYANRVTEFRLGIPLGGIRHMVLEWEEAGRFRSPPERRRIEGAGRL